MRRRSFALAALALVAAGCGSSPQPLPPVEAAVPQRAQLDWVESFGEPGARVIFRVRSLEVLADGWRARIGLTNDTVASFSLGDRKASLDRTFGVMLFRTGDLRELEQRNSAGELPAIRRARAYEPSLPLVLDPGTTWEGAISARGSLAAGRYLRVVFGTLVPVGDAPPGLPDRIVWITDHAYRLRD